MTRSVVFRSLTPSVGAEVTNIDLRDPLESEAVIQIKAGLEQYGVLLFSNQGIEPDHQYDFARSLGQIRCSERLPERAGTGRLANIAVISTDNGGAGTTAEWHADGTWESCPPAYTILNMRETPDAGGDTMWASQTLAYEWLSPAMQSFLEPLTARHVLFTNHDRYVDHPLVTVRPSGRKSLFINRMFTRRINELTGAESDAVLEMLLAHSVRPEFICRWSWHVGDVAIWDNHFVQHYAINDYGPARRSIHRIEVVGPRPTGPPPRARAGGRPSQVQRRLG